MIKIHYKIYNKLCRELTKHRAIEKRRGSEYRFPWLYLLATHNSKENINKAERILDTNTDIFRDHCYRMSNIPEKVMIKECIKLMKKGYTVVGLARVGDFHRPSPTHHNDGPVYSELYHMNPKTIFMTVEPVGINIQTSKKNMPYKITYKNG